MLKHIYFHIVNIIKYTVDRQRPFELDVKIEKLSTGGSPSFPSGHTSDAFLMATCIMLLFGNKKWAIALVLSWAVFVAYSRIVLGVHYPSDVIGAILIGSANALIVNLGFANIKNNGKQIKHVWRK